MYSYDWMAISESRRKDRDSVCAGYVCFPVVGNFLARLPDTPPWQARKPKPTVGTQRI